MTGGVIARPAPRSRRAPWLNRKLLLAGIVLMIAVGFLIYNSMQGTVASYFVTVGELDQQAAQVNGQRVRVGGQVQPGSIIKGGVGQPMRFNVTDGTHSMPVIYNGDVPDIFANNVQVVVEGVYHEGGTFQADTLLTKCPSKFTATQTASQKKP